MAASSAAFERFQFSFFEDPNSARDGLATAALAQLEGEERIRAEDMLLIPFPHQDDLTIYGNDVIDWTSFGLRSI